MSLRILFIPSPVGPIGSGEGGGVETNIINLAPFLARRGHSVGVLTAKGAVTLPGVTVYEVEGALPPYALHVTRDSLPSIQAGGLLENLWAKAKELECEFDVIAGINYDWLAYYLLPFFKTPVCHAVSVSSLITSVDAIIKERYEKYPLQFAVNTKAQAGTFSFFDIESITKLYGGIDMERYTFRQKPQKRIAWVGRISPEKNLKDALIVARMTKLPIDICGKIQVASHWRKLLQEFPDVSIQYHGFIPQEQLQEVVGNVGVLLMTTKKPLIEAFGNVCIEAMAVGTPVVAYSGGGPDEIIQNGISGYSVQSNAITLYAKAVTNAFTLQRRLVRKRAESFSLEKMANRYVRWLQKVIDNTAKNNEK